MKIKEGFIKCKTAQGWAVSTCGELGRKHRMMITLNDSAAKIWDIFKNDVTPQEAAQLLCREYDIPESKAKESIELFINTLSKEDIFE